MVETLTIHRVRDGIADPDHVLKDRSRLDFYPLHYQDNLIAHLYVEPSIPKPPRWVRFVSPYATDEEIRVQGAATAAALIFPLHEHWYVLTFGWGRKLLRDSATEPRFGLKATLSAIHPAKVRSMDRKTFDSISRLTREQLSRDSSMASFGLNVQRDLLRAVTGKPEDQTLGSRMTGMDALSVTVDVTLPTLRPLLERYETLSRSETYKERYPWIDNIAQVNDRDQAHQLDLALARRIRMGETADIELAPPDIVDWADFSGFKYRTAAGAELFQELRVDDYLRDCRSAADVYPNELKHDQVYFWSAAADTAVHTWSLYRCINVEMAEEDGTFVLSDGTWYKVDTDFVADINARIDALQMTQEFLPPFYDDNEDAYNGRAADESDGRLFLMHDRPLRRATGFDPIEFCDLYSVDRVMIHVKRYTGSKSLSHLFEQGTVSAQLLLNDGLFRQEANGLLPPTHQVPHPREPVRSQDYEVAYAIIPRVGAELRLPFFSRISLAGSLDQLGQLGFKVTLTPVPT